MTTPKVTPLLKKPAPSRAADAMNFAQAETPAPAAPVAQAIGTRGTKGAPVGDSRLTSNVREDLHRKLKLAALDRKQSVREVLESLIEGMQA